MTEQQSSQAMQAILAARSALKHGQRMDARRWSLLAIRENPTLEEPWLILAAISSPQASITYLQHALELNPQSERAMAGMQWALNRLSSVPSKADLDKPQRVLSDTQPIKISPEKAPVSTPALAAGSAVAATVPPNAETIVEQFRGAHATAGGVKAPSRKPTSKKKAARSRGTNWAAALMISLFLLAGAFIVWAAIPSLNAYARSSAAPLPADILAKPSLTPTATATFTPTPTPTFTPTPTPTLTPTPTFTPTPSPTSTRAATALPTPDVPPLTDETGRWIDVDLSQQMLYAYDGETLVDSFLVSTGTYLHPTVTGQYHIYVKYLYTLMTGPGYYLPDVPYTMYFYEGYGIHGTYWHNNFGTPMSHGCINMRTSEAGWLYNWASVGTLVNIHE